ncbi:MAG: hypothetical protein E7576_08795 [Ruminococcaceae bacterium]|nr:hypothetical protein [Oscillospiraceae bacterium]
MLKDVAEKIDFLMKLTDTRNAALARALNFDPSYISRIRRRIRGIPPHEPFLVPAAAYFAASIREEYQKSAVSEELGREWPNDHAEAAALLVSWLEDSKKQPSAVPDLMRALALSQNLPGGEGGEFVPEAGTPARMLLFYGNSGKRSCVARFLSELVKSGQPYRLLLCSDEDMTWLYEDPAFVRTWNALLSGLIGNGSRIRIIHTVSRDLTEMWEAVRKWLPLYMTGAIEPYYYPRLQDGILRRSIFIAEGTSAVTAHSTRGQGDGALNCLVNDRGAVDALTDEFEAYLRLCRPLMRIVPQAESGDVAELLRGFLSAPGEGMISVSGDILICVKEDTGALVVSAASPHTVFSFTEPRLVEAMREYIESLPDAPAREERTAAAEAFLERLGG